jgi:hypothetical protein
MYVWIQSAFALEARRQEPRSLNRRQVDLKRLAGKGDVTMQDHTRRAVAFIAGSIINQRSPSSVFDYAYSSSFSMSIKFASNKIDAYDYTKTCSISGPANTTKISLYHYGNSKHIDLFVQGNSFKGYDYDSTSHFDGKVSGKNISLYDYETGTHYNYSIS